MLSPRRWKIPLKFLQQQRAYLFLSFAFLHIINVLLNNIPANFTPQIYG